MPQMLPMNWLILFYLIILLFYYLVIKTFFSVSHTKVSTQISSYSSTSPNSNWLW